MKNIKQKYEKLQGFFFKKVCPQLPLFGFFWNSPFFYTSPKFYGLKTRPLENLFFVFTGKGPLLNFRSIQREKPSK